VSKNRNVKNTRNAPSPAFGTFLFVITLALLICLNNVTAARPAAAAAEPDRWTKVNIPAEGEAGHWALAAGSDIRRLTAGGDGTLYASVAGLAYTFYRSVDGGYSWEHIGNVSDAITDMAISPQDPETIYYATTSQVYRSTNGGQTFQILPPNPGGAGANHKEIASIDVTRLESDIVVAGTRDTDDGEFGGVYILDESEIVPAWSDTGIGGYDIGAVAFSPHYPDDGVIVAVATDETATYISVKNGDDGWNAETGYARLDIAADAAAIAFPGSFSADEPVVFVAIDTGAGAGDVYEFNGSAAPAVSSAFDLNVGSAYGSNGIDIAGLSVYDDGATTVLLAGAADSAMTYISADGGITWTRSLKPPTGGSGTGVLIAPDFATTGRMYAVTGGDGSAFSLSRDTGATWNQISLMDAAIDSIIDLAPSPDYSQDSTIFMITFGSGPYSGGLWRSRDGGDSWERTLADSTDALESLSRVALPPEYGDDGQTVFVAGSSRGRTAIWESTDGGQTYQRRFTRNPAGGAPLNIDTWAIADKTTILIGSYDGSQGMVYKSTNRGLTFAQGVPAGSQPLNDIALSPDYAQDGIVLVGNSNGRVYVTDNRSTSFELLSGDAATLPFSGGVSVACDPSFANNRTVYAASDSAGSGIYRFTVGESTAWESIDDGLPAGAMFRQIILAEDGTFYAADAAADGGLERCLKPTFASPAFETVTRGLSSGATLYGLWQAGHQIWSVDTTSNRLMTYNDTLTVPPLPVAPDDGASAAGNLIDHSVRNITLDWETLEGATGYEWECSYNDTFTADAVAFGDTTSGSSVRLPALEPATTYHWRVRAGSPTLSPWSEKRSFTTVMDTEPITLRPESPVPGAIDVPVKPVFQWTAVVGAEAYELLVATDAGMENPVIARTDENAVIGNVWQCDVTLDYATTYYWKVRAVSSVTSSAWSTMGIFTTEEAPPGPETPATDNEIVGMPANLETGSPPPNPSPAEMESMPGPSVNGTVIPNLSGVPGIPDWIIYLIGILISVIVLSLIVILVMVVKIKRVT
jgi:photosystem II stability/assembly factor-like uncharacterized protein